MKKYLPWFFLFAMVGGALGLYFVQNWDPYRNVPRVSLDRLNREEADWYAEGIFDYRLLVHVRFSTEQRRYDIEVRDNVLASAQSARWDEVAETWGPFGPITDEEATFFTIPGMFNMLRTDLLNEDVEREALRMELAEGQQYPGLIFLGNIVQEGAAVDGTELIIEVLTFEEIES